MVTKGYWCHWLWENIFTSQAQESVTAKDNQSQGHPQHKLHAKHWFEPTILTFTLTRLRARAAIKWSNVFLLILTFSFSCPLSGTHIRSPRWEAKRPWRLTDSKTNHQTREFQAQDTQPAEGTLTSQLSPLTAFTHAVFQRIRQLLPVFLGLPQASHLGFSPKQPC